MNPQGNDDQERRRRCSTPADKAAELHIAASPGGNTPPSQRRTLTHDKVLAAAVVVIDADGADDFTLRAVADRLGVETMALYRYFPSRRQLLEGVVDHLTDDLFAGSSTASDSERWQDFITRVAFNVRRSAMAHPPLFRLIATTAAAAPWIRPPLRNLHTIEEFLETLQRGGFDDSAALGAYHAFASFLLGNLLLDINYLHAPVNPPLIDLPGYPRLYDLQAELARDRSAEEFSSSLSSLILSVNQLGHQRTM